MRPLSLFLALSMTLAGCQNEGGEESEVVRLNWSTGDMFHVAARYKVNAPKTEETPVALDGSTEPAFGDNWTDEIVWTYQVVETGTTPSEGDELYEYAVEGEGVTPISVVRAWADASLNDDTEILEADPVIYLVFRESNDRLMAMVQFVNVEGERTEKAWSTSKTDRSWSPLSQSMLTGLPTYLAPAGARWATDERLLENGDTLTSEAVSDGVVDVFFDDEVGGGLVVTRYEAGQPWPTETVADNVETRLLSNDEVDRRRSERPAQLPDVPENFDYLAGLRSTVNIDAALKLDADTLDGGWDAQAADGYLPWAGSWWPQAQGSLVFGYSNRDTFSKRIKADIDPIKRELDSLSEQMRGLTQGSADYNTKLATYKTKQTEYTNKLVTFYDKILADLDGGKIKIENGKIKHTVDGWSYDLNTLSPMDKFALAQYYKGNKYPNPFYIEAWELLNHYSPGGGSWWGHCNGWSGAAILTNEPKTDVSYTMNGAAVKYTSADMKGLLSESHYSTYSSFYGARYNGNPGEDVADLTPKAFHIIVSHYIRDRRVPLVFDTVATAEVWNFPAYHVDLDLTETTTGGTSGLVNLNTADRNQLDALDGIAFATADKIIAYRTQYGAFQTVEDVKKAGVNAGNFAKFKDKVTVSVASGERTFHVVATVDLATDGVTETHVDSGAAPQHDTEVWGYTLVTDASGNVLRGTWDNNEKHPDFAWIPYENPVSASSGGSENPYLPYGVLLDVIGKGFRRQ